MQANADPPRLALTAGEPAGVGPDLLVRIAQAASGARRIAIADPDVLLARARLQNLPLNLIEFDPDARRGATPAGSLEFVAIPTRAPVTPGVLDPENAAHVLAMLEAAAGGCLGDVFDAMVTGPVHKGVINQSGIPFTGHTEWLAERAGGIRPVMLLVAGSLRVALATTHLPLRRVADAITTDLLDETLRVLDTSLRGLFHLPNPRIAVCGLNPHAGEQGVLGSEEIDVIEPTLTRLRREGFALSGPLPADTAFTPRSLAAVDAVLAMYHDQGLPVLKHAGFGQAVNVTLGLRFIRTSVDHGTALDRAGTGRIDTGSLLAAERLAAELVRLRGGPWASAPRNADAGP